MQHKYLCILSHLGPKPRKKHFNLKNSLCFGKLPKTNKNVHKLLFVRFVNGKIVYYKKL
jgi:hypothetical protein